MTVQHHAVNSEVCLFRYLTTLFITQVTSIGGLRRRVFPGDQPSIHLLL
jgi:hypothetical protein